jgi:hypothetical protein
MCLSDNAEEASIQPNPPTDYTLRSVSHKALLSRDWSTYRGTQPYYKATENAAYLAPLLCSLNVMTPVCD